VICLWWDILKIAEIRAKTKDGGKLRDGDINVSFDKDNCNRKLKELQKFLESYSTKIESVLKNTIEKINKNNPPTNKETTEDGMAGTAPLKLKKVVGDSYKGMVEYTYGTTITRGDVSIYIYYEYNPIPEEAACKLIELFNSPESDDLNMNSDYKNDPQLHAHRKIGMYNRSSVVVSAGPSMRATLKLGIVMDVGYFSNYGNETEHYKEIYDAIRLRDAGNKIESILR
jgi:hypothetical protein